MQKSTKELKLTFRINLVKVKLYDQTRSDGCFGKTKCENWSQKVKLTSSQVQIARKLGVPLEEYAKQLLNTEGA
jgi:hypothetical protein